MNERLREEEEERVMGRKRGKEGIETLGILASRYTVHLLTYIEICTPEKGYTLTHSNPHT